MKIIQTSIEKNFFVEHDSKMYYVNYLISDGHILGLLNRDEWEITCEDNETLNIYEFKSMNKKDKEKVRRNRKLADKLITLCTKHLSYKCTEPHRRLREVK